MRAALDQVAGDPGGSDVVVLLGRLLRVAATMATISAAAARTIAMIPNVLLVSFLTTVAGSPWD